MLAARKGVLVTGSEPKKIVLDVDWWLENPGEIITTLSSHIGAGVTIDASETKVVPAQIAQLLAAAKKTADAKGSPFILQGANDPVVRSLSTLGLLDNISGGTI